MNLRKLLKALDLLEPYLGEGGSVTAEHDQIWLWPEKEVPEKVADKLDELGFHRADEGDNGFSCWV